MTAPLPQPMVVPDLDIGSEGREVGRLLRTSAVMAGDVAGLMRANSIPPGWLDHNGLTMRNRLRESAIEIGTIEDGLHAGIVALDRFMDQADGLRARHDRLIDRRAHLARQVHDHNSRPEATPAARERLEAELRTFARDVDAWNEDVRLARHAAVSALAAADNPVEARRIGMSAPAAAALLSQLRQVDHTDPQSVNSWWRNLSRAEREELKLHAAKSIGNLNGIPVEDRDEANRVYLDQLDRALAAKPRLSGDDRRVLEQIEATRSALSIPGRKASTADIAAYLMMFDPHAAHGDGRVAVSYGNPDTADHTSTYVPGLTTNGASIDTVGADAFDIQRSATAQRGGSVASIAWIGYDAPDWGGEGSLAKSLLIPADAAQVLDERSAKAGAEQLSSFIDGLKVTDEGSHSHRTVIGHSYGSTTVAHAAAGDMRADDNILIGSPGAGGGNDHASDLHGRTWVGSSEADPVSHLGNRSFVGLGDDPASQSFGGHRFLVEDETTFGREENHTFAQHTSYLDTAADEQIESGSPNARQSASMNNIANIVVGQYDDVREVDGRRSAMQQWQDLSGAQKIEPFISGPIIRGLGGGS